MRALASEEEKSDSTNWVRSLSREAEAAHASWNIPDPENSGARVGAVVRWRRKGGKSILDGELLCFGRAAYFGQLWEIG